MVELPIASDLPGNLTDKVLAFVRRAVLLLLLSIILVAVGCALALRVGVLFEKVPGCTGL